jgi:exopolysaccharide biosynthesis WecB/TagA/CpsF family protein
MSGTSASISARRTRSVRPARTVRTVRPANPINSQVVLGGSRVDLVERRRVLQSLDRALKTREPIGVSSANLDHIFHFGTNGASRADFAHGALRWLNVLDGAPLAVRAAQLTGQHWQRQAGSDLLDHVLDLAEYGSWRVGFVGGTADMHELLGERLHESHPDLEISGFWAPERRVVEDQAASAALAGRIQHAGTDILVVGFGKPRQEVWIERHWAATGANVLLAFGASADFVAGAVERAPRPFRATGTEWLYRLAHEPRRLRRRYLHEGPQALRCLARDSYPVGQVTRTAATRRPRR